jgi:hypothetical protein
MRHNRASFLCFAKPKKATKKEKDDKVKKIKKKELADLMSWAGK